MSELTELRDINYRGVSENNWELAISVLADDVVNEYPGGASRGIEESIAWSKAWEPAVPDFTLVAARTFESGDTIITECIYSGTHTGPLVGDAGTIPATGRSFSFPGVDFMQFRNGKCVNRRMYWDNMSFMAQLGVIPTEAATAGDLGHPGAAD